MRVAVFTLTRDRLAYSQHCLQMLWAQDCEFDHYVLDQASSDGSRDWLADTFDREPRLVHVSYSDANVGIWRGFNLLIDQAGRGYDLYVTFDNDCELLDAHTLAGVCELALSEDMALSPVILGLRNPPIPYSELPDGGIVETQVIGNVFMAIPAWAVGLRRIDSRGPFDESRPAWGGDEVPFAAWMRDMGSSVGYAAGYRANHYRTSAGQDVDYPEYLQRKRQEMAA